MSCDCPACLPPCQRTGVKCFITCARCTGIREEDAFGPLTSRTVRFTHNPLPVPAHPTIYSELFWMRLLEAGIIKGRPEA